MNKARPNIFAILLVVLLILGGGCAGGTHGTGLGTAFGGGSSSPSVTGVAYTRVQGRLLDSKGRAVVGASVTARTTRNEEKGVTDASGKFELPVVVGRGEAIELIFKIDGKSLNYILKNPKLSNEPINLELRLGSDGKILLGVGGKWK